MNIRYFSLREVFKDIITGEFHVSSILEKGNIPLISCKAQEKGVEGYFDIPLEKTYSNCVTIACDGKPLTSYYHNYPISAKDNVLICIPSDEVSMKTIFYVVAYLNQLRWRFSYGRKFYSNKINAIRIPLPISENGKIDENYLDKNISINYENELIKKQKKAELSDRKFKIFDLNSLVNFDRKYAPYMNELDMNESNKIPYVTTTEDDNGISVYVDIEPNFTKNSLSVSLDGSCGMTFYQFEDFIAGEKTAVLTLKEGNNPYLLFYIGALIRMTSWRYDYGRKLSMGRLKKLAMPFPVDDNGRIDLRYIENMVKTSFGWKVVEKYL